MMIEVKKAREIILNSITYNISCEYINIDQASGRVLREDIISDIDIPPFDNSAMDGYAVRAEDIQNASYNTPVQLKIIDEIPAGHLPRRKVYSGEASLIMTGAIMPDGANCVVIVEHTMAGKNKDEVKIFYPGKPGDNIRIRGEDIKKGEKVLESGIILKSSDIGLLAALGKKKVKVSKKPKVAILASGDELVDIDTPLVPGKIRCSNNYMLASLVTKYGGIPYNLGIAQDNIEDMIAHLNMGKDADIIITTGGISVGKYDIVKETLEKLGSEFKFWKVAMKPGKPLAFCIWNNKPVFALPGNPISSLVSFEQFVRPALWKICGKRELNLPRVMAKLDNEIKKKKGIKYFARCRVYIKENELRATIQGPHGSNMLKPLTRTNGLAIIPEDIIEVKKEDTIEIELIESYL